MVTPAEVGFVGSPQLASHRMNGLLVPEINKWNRRKECREEKELLVST